MSEPTQGRVRSMEERFQVRPCRHDWAVYDTDDKHPVHYPDGRLVCQSGRRDDALRVEFALNLWASSLTAPARTPSPN